MWRLLTFRFQHAFITFWRKHPAIVAPVFGVGFVGGTAILLVVSILRLSHTDSWMLWLASLAVISLPSAVLLAFALMRWVPMISMEDQRVLIAALPDGCVPKNRRICMLERNLIVRTQGVVNAARASQMALGLGTEKATGVTRPAARL